MSVKLIAKGANEKGNENIKKNLLHGTVQKPVVVHSVSKPSPILSDKKEFPSLNESSGKAANSSYFTGKFLKYSDKLKSFSSNENTVSHSKCDFGVANTFQLDDKIPIAKTVNKLYPNDSKRDFIKREVFQNASQSSTEKLRFVSTNKVETKSNQNALIMHGSQSSKESNSSNQNLAQDNKKEFSTKHLTNSSVNSKNMPFKSPTKSGSVNLISKSDNQAQTRKLTVKSESKEADSTQCNAKVKKKKNRKSKVKRQVAVQSGKITVLTPEVHLKILNQTSGLTSQPSKSVLTDINNEEEYPELGKPLLQTSQKEKFSKKDIFTDVPKETSDEPLGADSEDKCIIIKDIKEAPVCGGLKTIPRFEKPSIEKKGKSEAKASVHSHDPITISFFDILLNKNPKPKVDHLKDEIDVPNNVGSIGVPKIKIRKDVSQPHNLLDSSSPMVKRGKERENPKPKRPSQLKKIILLDRKARREQLLYLKSNTLVENDTADNELVNNSNTDEPCQNDDIEANVPIKNNSSYVTADETLKIDDEILLQLSDNSFDLSTAHVEEITDPAFSQSEDESNMQDELVPKMQQFSLSEKHDSSASMTDFSSSSSTQEDIKVQGSLVKHLSLNKASKNERDSGVSSTFTESVSSIEKPTNISDSPDSLLNKIINNFKKSENSDKERAVKILLHTRNFREYCDHLISKDIDDAVYSLLDDLARFQDRLHQKDPVKARMKRRMINGIKEVKKYIKLRKLKCIIIAVDIENVETQGGLNDVLNDIKASAADHHIPCVFALSRKVLGKVCRKPVPISCIGIFNFEGSEANFKKMVELQTQSKVDYNEIFSKLTLKLTDEEAMALLKARAEAPETLHVVRTEILNDFFMKSKIETTEVENTNSTD